MGQPRDRFWEFTHSLFQEIRLRCSGRQLVEVDRGRLPAKAAKSKCVRIILGKEAIFPLFFLFSFIFPLLDSLKARWQLSTVVSLVIAFQFCVRLLVKTRQSKHCGFSIYIFDNSKSKSMVRLVRSEKMALSGLVFARKIARMILIQNI